MAFTIEKGQITGFEKTPAGMLRVFGTVAHTGWLDYEPNNGKKQYVDKETLFDPEHLKSIEASVVTLHHPPTRITPENYQSYLVGFTTNRIIPRDNSIDVELVICDKQAIDAVLDKSINGLSMGYEVETEPYGENKLKQVKRICNHIALTDSPRAKNAKLNLDADVLIKKMWHKKEIIYRF